MKKVIIPICFIVLCSNYSLAADRYISMSVNPEEAVIGKGVGFECTGVGEWQPILKSAKIVIKDANGSIVVGGESMNINGTTASYDYVIPFGAAAGNWKFKCILRDNYGRERESQFFAVERTLVTDPPSDGYLDGPIAAHNTITTYDGPSTCIECHQKETEEMLNSLHMKWKGPTPNLINTNGEELGKAVGGINTFCTYAVSSRGACYSCHVRADGNAPHAPEATDVDCLMCHSDTYQRRFVADPENTETVVNIFGETRTYVFGKVDQQGNYTTVPDFDKMPEGTNMVNLARTVHMPSSQSCLRCHAKAGGGDWTKRGDMGLSSANPSIEEDFHLSRNGAGLSCVNCHSALNHKIAGRGIDLRQNEVTTTSCTECHDSTPHANTILNRHAQGQVSCQVCHIREYGKGGKTEISRDWLTPVWNPAFCSGQGGFVGEEIKASNVKPEYVWFDGTSYVYNLGETITPGVEGIYHMAKAQGAPFDGNAKIVPIKRHFTNMPLHESGTIVPPAIMWMFMTGDFNLAVQKGMEEQGMIGNYLLVEADAEMLITHGVDPKEKAPTCMECHDGSGSTPDGERMLPLTALGYHDLPDTVLNCTLCHEPKKMSWESLHSEHRKDNVSCISCHTPEPTGYIREQNVLCSSCHELKSWRDDEGHKGHIEKGLDCTSCHTFN